MANKSVKVQKITSIIKTQSLDGLKNGVLIMSHHNLIMHLTHTWYKIFCNHVGNLVLSNHLEQFRKIANL